MKDRLFGLQVAFNLVNRFGVIVTSCGMMLAEVRKLCFEQPLTGLSKRLALPALRLDKGLYVSQ